MGPSLHQIRRKKFIVRGLEGPTLHPPPTIDQTSFFLLLYPHTLILRMLTWNKLGLNGCSEVKYALREQ